MDHLRTHVTVDSNPYEPPHARDGEGVSPIPRLTMLAARWLAVHCAVAAIHAGTLLVLRTHRHQLHASFPSKVSWLAYVVPRFLRVATYGGLAVSFVKGRPRFGTALFVLELLSLAVSADAIVAMVNQGSDIFRILWSLAVPLSVVSSCLLAFGPPGRAPVGAGIGLVCLTAVLKATQLLGLL